MKGDAAPQQLSGLGAGRSKRVDPLRNLGDEDIGQDRLDEIGIESSLLGLLEALRFPGHGNQRNVPHSRIAPYFPTNREPVEDREAEVRDNGTRKEASRLVHCFQPVYGLFDLKA